MYSYRAFTMIELLIVTAVIGLLVALIVPTIGMIRISAQRVACASQERQLGLAVASYALDNRGALVAFSLDQKAEDTLNGWTTQRTITWQRLLAGYSEAAYEVDQGDVTTLRERRSVLHCAQYDRGNVGVHWGAGYGMRPTHLIGTMVGERYKHNDYADSSTAYNCPKGVVRLGQIRLPESTILLGDSVDYRLNTLEAANCGATTSSFSHNGPHDGGKTCWKELESNWVSGSPYRHRTANYLFYDGHVEALFHTVAAQRLWAPDGQN